MSSTKDIDTLIDLMAKMPGLGPRSARRAVLHLIRKRALLLTPLADIMQVVAETARECLNCGNVGTTEMCAICAPLMKRANGELCVVEERGGSVGDGTVRRVQRALPRAGRHAVCTWTPYRAARAAHPPPD